MAFYPSIPEFTAQEGIRLVLNGKTKTGAAKVRGSYPLAESPSSFFRHIDYDHPSHHNNVIKISTLETLRTLSAESLLPLGWNDDGGAQ